jgi:hypothetical protein
MSADPPSKTQGDPAVPQHDDEQAETVAVPQEDGGNKVHGDPAMPGGDPQGPAGD